MKKTCSYRKRKCKADRPWTPPVRSEKQLPATQRLLFGDLGEKPLIIERPDHNISRKNIDQDALKVLYRLKEYGFKAYLVGGSVRDLQMGETPKDYDIGTDATPAQLRRIFRYSRIIGKRFRLVHVYFKGGKIIEVSTFRKKTDFADTEAVIEGLGDDELFGTPLEDAFRRDLTINGLFYNIADFSIIDYVGGMEDLRSGVIRTIGDPERRFLRDPVRMMRVIRHAARKEFSIDPLTWSAVIKHSGKIRLCAIPRVRDEWLKDMQTGVSSRWIKLMLESGLFQAVFPCYSQLSTDPVSEESEDRVKLMLTGLFKGLDSHVKKNGGVSEPMLLAMLAYPLLSSMPEWNRLRSDKIRWATHEVRSFTKNIFVPYDFGRHSREIMSQILATQNPIEVCVKNNKWPKRVWTKEFFPEALVLYNAVQAVQGKPLLINAPGAKSISTGKRKKRYYYRKPRKR